MNQFLEKILLIKPFLKMISEGKFFKNIFSWFLRIDAVLVLIGFLYGSYKLWDGMSGGFEVKIFFASLFIEIILLAIVFAVINILLIRAADIDALPLSTDYVVIPIFVIVAKMVGEILAVFYALAGLAAGLAIWIAGGVPMPIPGLSSLSGGGGFAGGLTAIIGGPILGFMLLSLFYFIAEQIGVLVDIARNTKK